jgi:hypothetical protein
MSFGVHPFILIAAIGTFLALVAAAVACIARSGSVRALMIILALVFLLPAAYVFLAFHPELVDGRFRTYKAFYQDIQIGMTRDEVFATLDRRYPKSGPRQRPKTLDDMPHALNFFMNPEMSREPNCEGIFLTLTNGHVVKKEYSPD